MTGATVYRSLLYILLTVVIGSVLEDLMAHLRNKRRARLNQAEHQEIHTNFVAQLVRSGVIFVVLFPFVSFGLMWLTTQDSMK